MKPADRQTRRAFADPTGNAAVARAARKPRHRHGNVVGIAVCTRCRVAAPARAGGRFGPHVALPTIDVEGIGLCHRGCGGRFEIEAVAS